jgi:hypothetical protein
MWYPNETCRYWTRAATTLRSSAIDGPLQGVVGEQQPSIPIHKIVQWNLRNNFCFSLLSTCTRSWRVPFLLNWCCLPPWEVVAIMPGFKVLDFWAFCLFLLKQKKNCHVAKYISQRGMVLIITSTVLEKRGSIFHIWHPRIVLLRKTLRINRKSDNVTWFRKPKYEMYGTYCRFFKLCQLPRT